VTAQRAVTLSSYLGYDNDSFIFRPQANRSMNRADRRARLPPSLGPLRIDIPASSSGSSGCSDTIFILVWSVSLTPGCGVLAGRSTMAPQILCPTQHLTRSPYARTGMTCSGSSAPLRSGWSIPKTSSGRYRAVRSPLAFRKDSLNVAELIKLYTLGNGNPKMTPRRSRKLTPLNESF
jgi:hypothetical protein